MHDDSGRFASLEKFFNMLLAEREKQVERIFAEREASAEFKRIALKEALDEAKRSTDRALLEAKTNVEQKLVEAKIAADEREASLKFRLDLLEKGGAPFADRLNETANQLRRDVDVLNEDAVRTQVLEALRVQQQEEVMAQKRVVRAAFIAAALSFLFSGMLLIIETLTKVF